MPLPFWSFTEHSACVLSRNLCVILLARLGNKVLRIIKSAGGNHRQKAQYMSQKVSRVAIPDGTKDFLPVLLRRK
jgi:hypothetical protein